MSEGKISEGSLGGVSDLLARQTPPIVDGNAILPTYPSTNPMPVWKDFEIGPIRTPREGPITIGSTVFDKTPPLVVGERWYIRYPGARALTEVEIIDVTPRTVLVQSVSYYSPGTRYEKKDLDFVERCKAVEQTPSTPE